MKRNDLIFNDSKTNIMAKIFDGTEKLAILKIPRFPDWLQISSAKYDCKSILLKLKGLFWGTLEVLKYLPFFATELFLIYDFN